MGLTDKGYVRPTYDDVLQNMITSAETLFGEDIDTTEQTPMGKYIRINALELAKAYEDLEGVYYARFPNTATGVSLDRLCVFAGIKRNDELQAVHEVELVGTPDSVVKKGFAIGTESEMTFELVEDTTIGGNGTVTALFVSDEPGIIGNVPVGSINVIITPVAEVESINHIAMYRPGADAESDVALRKRLSETIKGSGAANINAIRSALLRIPTVASVGIVENATDDVDSAGRPPRSYECYVYGGDDYNADIAHAIFDKAPIGIKTHGSISVTVKDDGGYDHIVSFSKTAKIIVDVKISVRTNTTFRGDGVCDIRGKVTDHINGLGIGTPLVLTALYGTVYGVVGVDEVTLLAAKKSTDSVYTTNNINCDTWEALQAGTITVEVVS